MYRQFLGKVFTLCAAHNSRYSNVKKMNGYWEHLGSFGNTWGIHWEHIVNKKKSKKCKNTLLPPPKKWYEKKTMCYWEHLENLKNMLKIHWKHSGNTFWTTKTPKNPRPPTFPKKNDVRWKSCAIVNLGNILEIHWEHIVNNKNPKDPRTPSLPPKRKIPRPFRCMLDHLMHHIHIFYS